MTELHTTRPDQDQRVVDTVETLLGCHPSVGTTLGDYLAASDTQTSGNTPHRLLTEKAGSRDRAVRELRASIVRHHASEEQLTRAAEARDALARQGIAIPQSLRRFPSNPDTQKGNFAEIVLAEYVCASGGLGLPVYRLRHNPNVDQSMKGDDVLAFDFAANPVRLIVGESKFRKESSLSAVREIVVGLAKSHASGIPISLQFVADHVADSALAGRIMACARLFATKALRIDYVGLLVSDQNAANRVAAHETTELRHLVLLSLGLDAPEELVTSCYAGLE